MKKLLLLLPLLALLAGCSNEFDVAAPWKEIPVVYAILSAKDTAQYIRVEKAFLDPQTDALEIAQIADSLYYPADAITVYLERSSNNTRVQLTRVDGNLEGFPRRSGIFATQPNWLYKVKTPAGQGLAVGERYRLVIKRADGKDDITAATVLPNDFQFTVPNQQQSPPLLNFFKDQTTSIRWRTDVNGVFFNGNITVRYREVAPNGTVLAQKALVWSAFKNKRRTDNVVGSGLTPYAGEAELNGEDFFNFLADNILPANEDPACNGCFRYFDFAAISLEGGGREISEYLSTASVASGITSAEAIPTYTNISEGFGIFTSKNVTTLQNIKIETKTVDEMNRDDRASRLNFTY